MVTHECFLRCTAICAYEYCESSALHRYLIKFPNKEVLDKYIAGEGALLKPYLKGYRYDVKSLSREELFENTNHVEVKSNEELIIIES